MIFCSLFSGSSGNSIFIATKNTKILIDAGLPGKTIEKALCDIGQDVNMLDAIFVTHEHIDHTKGVGVLSRKYNIPVYANEPTWNAMESIIGKVSEHNIKCIADKYVTIKDIDVQNYRTSHDAACSVGYSIYEGRKKACIATDLGYFSDDVKHSITDADILLLESNHDVEMLKVGPYPYSLKMRILSNIGHLSNDACGNAIISILNDKHKRIVLGHLSKTNNYPDLAYQTVINILNENKVKLNKDVTLTLAKRDMPSSYIEF